MKRWHLLGWTAFLVVVVLLGYRDTALARTESAGHALEAEVEGYRIALTSQNEWAQGDNTILVELTDSMGMPVNNAEVEVLITPGLDAHGESEESAHGPEAPAHTAADPGAAASHGSSVHNAPLTAPEAPAHDAMSSAPAAPMAFQGEGTYKVQAQLASSGPHEVRATVHVDGEMLQAELVIGEVASSARSLVLWTFAATNAAILFFAVLLRKPRLVTVRNGA